MITTSRRSLIAGLASLIAAPAIARAGSLMPVSARNLGLQYVTFSEVPLPSMDYLPAITLQNGYFYFAANGMMHKIPAEPEMKWADLRFIDGAGNAHPLDFSAYPPAEQI